MHAVLKSMRGDDKSPRHMNRQMNTQFMRFEEKMARAVIPATMVWIEWNESDDGTKRLEVVHLAYFLPDIAP